MSLFGTWQVITAKAAGQALPEALINTMQLTLTETAYTVSVAGTPDKGTVVVDESAAPRRLTITGTDGPNAGSTIKAIYALNGDDLTIAYDRSGEAFPEDFESRAGKNDFVAVYRRA